MSEALYRLTYEATVDDANDVSWRLAHRTHAFGGEPVIQCEIELRPSAVWVRQGDLEMLFPWTRCTSVLSNVHDIELNFTPGICVIRNRHFASPADRQVFLDNARRLSGFASHTPPTNPS